MKQQLKQILIATLTIVVFGVYLFSLTTAGKQEFNKVFNTAKEQNPSLYTVVSFADGDTISVDINGTTERIRFIGVDTPEKNHPSKPVQCFSKAASKFTKDLIGDSKVRLAVDPSNTNRDRYDRLLRYVYLPDGTLVNGEIIRRGYGFAYTAFPFEKSKEFRAYEEYAKLNNVGLWAGCEVINNNGYMQTNSVEN